MKSVYFIVLFLVKLQELYCLEDVKMLSAENFQPFTERNELVMVDFFADWCHFSQLLKPIFIEANKLVLTTANLSRRVSMAMVDCESQHSLCASKLVAKYPTLKLYQYGQPLKREYRGQRTVQAFINYMTDLLKDPIEYMENVSNYKFQPKNSYVIAHFEEEEKTAFNVFRKVAVVLRYDCKFIVTNAPGNHSLVFRTVKTNSLISYSGEMLFDKLNAWAHDLCVPLVRELTFQNAEELTEERLPFFLLFYSPTDKITENLFRDVCQKHLIHEKHRIQFLVANGEHFSHPLAHIGKSVADLPVIAIDSFKHIYVLPTAVPHALKNPQIIQMFINDLFSGKLHREFHFGPDKIEKIDVVTEKVQRIGSNVKEITPPESVFKKLAPSPFRYSLIKEEL